jgi:hypothetical protein
MDCWFFSFGAISLGICLSGYDFVIVYQSLSVKVGRFSTIFA